MESRIDRIKKQLHSASYKLTPQREATVAVLLEHEEDHLSAEDVYLLVKEKAPEIECGAVDEIQEDLLEDVEAVVEKRWNFIIKDHRLTFHGICWRCHDKNDESNEEK